MIQGPFPTSLLQAMSGKVSQAREPREPREQRQQREPRMELQWLILFPGRPSVGDWRRFDAAARIVRAALSYRTICHMVFGDRTRISLQAEFLDTWTGTEAHYIELIQAIAKGQMYEGVSHQPYDSGRTSSESLSAMVHEMLLSADVVLDFREDGSMVIGRFDDAQTPSARSALCVIGGVRDIEQREHGVLNQLCEKLKKPQLSVSLGTRAELTSKCIKVPCFGWAELCRQCRPCRTCHPPGPAY